LDNSRHFVGAHYTLGFFVQLINLGWKKRDETMDEIERLKIESFGYGSIPIHTIFRGMNIHLPAILMFTRGIGF